MSAGTGTSGNVHIGTSGWNYPEWRGKFYPQGLAQTRELHFMGEQFDTLEINSSFYRLMRDSTYQKWADSVPADFQYAVKGWKQVTHIRRLTNALPEVAQFFASGIKALGPKMGPILWQLPPSLSFSAEVLETFLAELPQTFGDMRRLAATAPPPVSPGKSDGSESAQATAPTQPTLLDLAQPLDPALDARPMRYALEPRSAGFGCSQAMKILERYNVCLVMADIAGRYPTFDTITSDMVYVRLHGSPRLYFSNYPDAVLEQWATRVKSWRAEGLDTYFYFDNTGAGWAPFNAKTLIEMVGEQDLRPQADGPVKSR